MNLAHDPDVSHARSKHIHCLERKIRGLVADGTIKPKYVKSEDNTTSFSTNPFGCVAFRKHRATLRSLRNLAENTLFCPFTVLPGMGGCRTATLCTAVLVADKLATHPEPHL
eukprot:6204597-Pleurochrysis_carterae.AAC.1